MFGFLKPFLSSSKSDVRFDLVPHSRLDFSHAEEFDTWIKNKLLIYFWQFTCVIKIKTIYSMSIKYINQLSYSKRWGVDSASKPLLGSDEDFLIVKFKIKDWLQTYGKIISVSRWYWNKILVYLKKLRYFSGFGKELQLPVYTPIVLLIFLSFYSTNNCII